jgi:hypothetical protein
MRRCASLLLLVLLALCMAPSAAMLAGGYTAERPLSTPAPSPGGQNLDAGSRALEVALDVRAEAEAKAGRSFQEWTPYSVKTQVVAGTNYEFKVCAAWCCRTCGESACAPRCLFVCHLCT